MNIHHCEIVICIATFRRPKMLRKTLLSLQNQVINMPFMIYLVDNDQEKHEGLTVLNEFPQLNIVTLKEPKQGNVHALNAVFSASYQQEPQAQYFLMIDDDEEATPFWLAKMVEAAKFSDIVGGPVHSQFEEDNNYINHPVFDTAYNASGFVPQIYGSGNCLITRAVLEKCGMPPFDAKFNFLGGADTDFFTRAKGHNFKFYWQQEALIHEFVPQSRTKIAWIMARSLRIGTLNAIIDAKRKTPIFSLIKSICAIPLYFMRMMVAAFKLKNWLTVLHFPLILIGRFMAHFNILPQPYKAQNNV